MRLIMRKYGIILWSHERGPMGYAPNIRLKQGGGPTLEVAILCTSNTRKVLKVVQKVRDIYM